MLPTEDLFVYVYVVIDDLIAAGAVCIPPRAGPAPACGAGPATKDQRASMPPILQRVIAEWRNRVEDSPLIPVTDVLLTAPPQRGLAGSTRPVPSPTTRTARAAQRSRTAHATGRPSPPETLQQNLDRELSSAPA
jgi:hypothetical protein